MSRQEGKNKKCEEDKCQIVIWRTYDFSENIKIIEKRCRNCWSSKLYLSEKGKNV